MKLFRFFTVVVVLNVFHFFIFPSTISAKDKRLKIQKKEQLRIKKLVSKLNSKDWQERYNAIYALKSMGPKAASTTSTLLTTLGKLNRKSKKAYYFSKEIEKTLVAFGKKSLPVLIKNLETKNDFVRYTVRKVIERVSKKEKNIVSLLIKALNTKDKKAKIATIYIFGGMGPVAKSAVPTLVKLLNNHDEDFKLAVICSLGGMGPVAKSAVPTLVKLLNNSRSNNMIKLAIISTLGRIGPSATSATPTLIRMFGHNNSDIQINIINSIIKMKVQNTQSLSLYITALKSKNWRIRCAGGEALGSMRKKAKQAVPFLLKLLNDDEYFVRETAKKALGKIGYQEGKR